MQYTCVPRAGLLAAILALGLPGAAPAQYAGSGTATDVTPGDGAASDGWGRDGDTPWADERARRDGELRAYLADTDPARARRYRFREGHTPALAWNWFDEHPVGFGGVPYVLLQTILSLDPVSETDPHLRRIATIWKKPSAVPAERGEAAYTLDHLGFGPHPTDYADGIAKPPAERGHHLPNGFVYDPDVGPEEVRLVKQRLKVMRDGLVGSVMKSTARALFGADYEPGLAKMLVLARGSLRKSLYGGELDYEEEHEAFQKAPRVGAVFFSCSACHQGRVLVGGAIDRDGNTVTPGRMLFLPGMPNTEVEAQYFAQLVMETGLAFIDAGFSPYARALPDPDAIEIDKDAVAALYTRMLDRALDDATVKTIHGASDDEVQRARLETYAVAKDFPSHLGDLVGGAIKTQFIYYQVALRNGFAPDNPRRERPDQRVPDATRDRIGQMDAFGIASGLAALHAMRPDDSFMEFLQRDWPENPLFSGIDTMPVVFPEERDPHRAGLRIVQTIEFWAPPVPAPVDIPSLSWSAHRELANWDGNQGAAARTLASGTSATGDPRKVNVRIHEPLNPLINNMPPPPWPFDLDREKAKRGMAIFNGEHLPRAERCAQCHRPKNPRVVPASELGVDPNRARVNTDVSRYALAGLVMEACRIFERNTGNDWCLPRDEAGDVIENREDAYDDYFKDTPGRVRAGTEGYKADMLHGIWARAPYLHNGSVPTLAHLMCAPVRPDRFLRGVLYYDEAMAGFEWAIRPRERYSAHDSQLVKEYDTADFGRSNRGHEYGARLCPDLSGLHPVRDREEIARRIGESRAGDLIEYLKTM